MSYTSLAPQGGADTVTLGDNRYALWVRSDRELDDGSPRGFHSEALLVALWNGMRLGPGGGGLAAQYVFTEREPCSDDCENNCKRIVEHRWQIYFIAPYERTSLRRHPKQCAMDCSGLPQGRCVARM